MRSLIAILVLIATPVWGDDWPQWTGSARDSIWHESGTLSKFPSGGPKVLWRVPIAGGYSGPAVAAGRVFVTDYERTAGNAVNDPGGRPKLQGNERVWSLEAASGKVLWKYEYPAAYEISYPAGPRATPTVVGEHVYVLGAQGQLTCLLADSGKVVWQVDLAKQFKAPTPVWGFCSHPLVDGELLYVMAGGEGSAVVALNRLTGQEQWRALTATDAGYCPPTMVYVAGQKQLAVWHPQAVHGLDPTTGKSLWSVKLEPDYGMSINPPRQMGDKLFVAGIKDKGVMIQLSASEPRAKELWRSTNRSGLGPVHSPVIPVGDVFYGVNRGGELSAIEIATGKRLWETYEATTRARFANSATAFLVLNGDRFFIMSETGELIIARLTPSGYQELDRAKILEPNHEAFGRSVVWSHPAFANRAIYARNDRELVCVSLAE
ncbi:MAG: PQQ-like beta-propeller repeat protein [Planctomycetaceae bacterium]|nr:PQQ-like beta-propeller repeat protein [Planctomycetaceae bacterium]